MSRKVALITGVTGQDGAYLAELLLGEGYGWSHETPVRDLVREMVTADGVLMRHALLAQAL